jgi:hypothetical protein
MPAIEQRSSIIAYQFSKVWFGHRSILPNIAWSVGRSQILDELGQLDLELLRQLLGLLDTPAGSHCQKLPVSGAILVGLRHPGALDVEICKHFSLSAAMVRAGLMNGGLLRSAGSQPWTGEACYPSNRRSFRCWNHSLKRCSRVLNSPCGDRAPVLQRNAYSNATGLVLDQIFGVLECALSLHESLPRSGYFKIKGYQFQFSTCGKWRARASRRSFSLGC